MPVEPVNKARMHILTDRLAYDFVWHQYMLQYFAVQDDTKKNITGSCLHSKPKREAYSVRRLSPSVRPKYPSGHGETTHTNSANALQIVRTIGGQNLCSSKVSMVFQSCRWCVR